MKQKMSEEQPEFVLERTKLEKTDKDLFEDISDLDKQCAKHLNYRPSKYRIRNQKLIKVINNLSIEPFTVESVEQYKRNFLQRLNAAGWEREHRVGITVLVVLMCSVLLLITSGITALMFSDYNNVFTICTLVVGCTGILYAMIRLPLIEPFMPIEWKSIPLEEFEEDIPIFMLQLALDIKRACPGTIFAIERITDKSCSGLFLFLKVSNNRGHDWVYIKHSRDPGILT